MRSFKPTKRFWQGYKGLYGSEPVQIDALKPKKKRQNIEEVEQIKFNIWFDKFLWEKDIRWFHSPNGGGRNPREGEKFKRMGVKAGVPDIILPMARVTSRSSYHGLVIELKKPDGKMSDVSETQNDWLEWFKRQNWSVHVAFGFEQAKAIVLDYFS